VSTLTPARGLALVRLAAVPLFLAAEKTVEDQVQPSAAFGWLLALAAVYAIAAAVAEWRWPGRVPASLFAALDFAVVVALIAASGGPFSQLRYALFVLPVTAATLVGPWRTALVSAGAVVAYVAIAATYPGSKDAPPDALGFESAQTLFLAWIGLAAVLLSSVLTARARQIQALADSRGRLVAQALDADGARIADAIAAVARGETVIGQEVQSGLAQQIRAQRDGRRTLLSEREREVLGHVADGRSAPEIGRLLFLSTATVKGHLQSLYDKLGVSDRAAAVAEAMRRGLLE
jgi:DNA-binding NarL/FixJ family response regulator